MRSSFNRMELGLSQGTISLNREMGGGINVPLDDQIIAMLTGPTDVYYRVSDLDTLFQEISSPTTPAVVDGVVGTIKDKGPNAIHLAAPADANRGILRMTDGVYWIEGDGSTTQYASAALASAASWNHYFAMAARRRNTTAFGFMRRTSSAIYVSLSAQATNNTASLATRNATGLGTSSAATSSMPINTWTALDGVAKPLVARVGVDGGAFVDAVTTANDAAQTGAFSLWRSSGGSIELSQSDFAGGVYLNREPTTDQRATINLLMRGLYNPAILTDLGLLIE